jgi:lysyl-tRNA synthetase class I
MVFVFLTPQPNNYSAMVGVDVKLDIMSTLNAISKGKTVATYQTCLSSLMVAASLVNSKVQVVLSNGKIIEVKEKDTLEDIMEMEKKAIEEAFNTPKTELQARNDINEIKINAMDFYQATYCEENSEKIEEEMVEAIKQSKEEETGSDIHNELGIIDTIINQYEIEGKISEISCNGTKMKEEDFFKVLNRIVLDKFETPRGAVAFSSTTDLNYIITFTSGTKINRENMEFSVEK